jgi:hypothetical protein
VGRLTSDDFEYICDRIKSKIVGWEKLMSYAGKDVMIKAVRPPSYTNFQYGCVLIIKWKMPENNFSHCKILVERTLDKKAMH